MESSLAWRVECESNGNTEHMLDQGHLLKNGTRTNAFLYEIICFKFSERNV